MDKRAPDDCKMDDERWYTSALGEAVRKVSFVTETGLKVYKIVTGILSFKLYVGQQTRPKLRPWVLRQREEV